MPFNIFRPLSLTHTDVRLPSWVDIIPLITVSFHPSTPLIKRDKAMPSAMFITIKHTHLLMSLHVCVTSAILITMKRTQTNKHLIKHQPLILLFWPTTVHWCRLTNMYGCTPTYPQTSDRFWAPFFCLMSLLIKSSHDFIESILV